MGFAKRTVVALVAIAALRAHAAEPWVIEGEAVNSVTGERLRKCSIQLIDLRTSAPQAQTTTLEGRFRFEGTNAGHYRIEAKKSGFVEYEFGAALPVSPQVSHRVTLKLIPLAILSGQVVDEDGDPWEWANISIFQLRWRDGQLRMIGFDSANLNEKGEFRKALPAGRYLLSVELQPGSSTHGTTWFMNTTVPERATTIELKPGEQRSGVVIQLQKSEKTWKITGRIIGELDLSGADIFRRPSIAVRRRTPLGLISEPGAAINPDGTFTANKLLPGDYELTVLKGYPRTAVGRVEVKVVNEEVTGVSLSIPPASRLAGRIKIEGRTESLLGQIIELSSEFNRFGLRAEAKNDGAFLFESVIPGSYQMHIGGVGRKWYLKEARIGTQTFQDGSIVISAGEENSLEVLLSPKVARIIGSLSEGEYSPGSHDVIAFSDDKYHQVHPAIFDVAGDFVIDGLAPGRYRLIAIPKLDVEEPWENSRVNDYLFSQATAVSVEEGQEAEIKLVPISRGKFEALLREAEIR